MVNTFCLDAKVVSYSSYIIARLCPTHNICVFDTETDTVSRLFDTCNNRVILKVSTTLDTDTIHALILNGINCWD